jgi:signal transduction histidine kinase
VQPSRPSSADHVATAGPLAVLLGGWLLGVVSARAAHEWGDVRRWLPDLVVGLVCIAAGAYALSRRRSAGWLLVATGGLWFVANLVPGLLYAHRGPLVHLFATYPHARPATRPQIVLTVAGYAIAVSRLWASDVAGPILAAAVLAFTIGRFVPTRGGARRARRTAVQAAAAFTFAVGVGAAVRAVATTGDAIEPMLLLYEATIAWIAIVMAARLRPSEAVVVADLVVELGTAPSTELRNALADQLGDPTLEVGYWTWSGDYVDVADAALTMPARDSDRVATYVARDGEPFAVLVHDAAVLDDPALVEAVATATRLAAANAALVSEVGDRLAELSASRRRLVVAADAERARLAARLRAGVEVQVAELRAIVAGAAAEATGSSDEHLRRAAEHLEQMVDNLRQLATGLHPRELDAGLTAAVTNLAERSPVPVDLVIEDSDGGAAAEGETAVAAYYVCAEALTNVAKHAGAACVGIELARRADRLYVTVVDDGCGGADPADGSGLRGLTDRVEALGGTLRVTSPPTGGTRLVAELPLGHQPPA